MEYREVNYEAFEGKTIKHAPISKVLLDKDYNANHFLVFDSVAQLVRCVDHNTASGLFTPRDYHKVGKNWTFGGVFRDLENTRKCLIDGSVPDSLLKKVEELKQEIIAEHPELLEFEKRARKMKRKKSFSEDGGELNIDRYMSGEPEYWQRSVKQPKKQIVKLMVNYCVSAETKTSTFIKNVIAAVAVVDILRSANINSEIWVGALGRNQKPSLKYSALICKIKGADDPVDFSRLLSCCAPGVFRYYTFAAWINLLRGGAMTQGYGIVLENHEAEEIREHFEFDAMLHLQASEQSTFQIITDTLTKVLPQN